MSDSSAHLDLDALADVLAGERDDGHLRSCEGCSDRLADLAAADASLTAALATLPAPPLPDGLSARLSGALAQERRRELATVRPLRRRRPAWLPAVAASAVLVMAGAAGWSVLGRSGAGPQDAAMTESSTSGGGGAGGSDTDAPESAAELAVPPSGTVTDWADEASRAAALSRLLEATDAAASSATSLPSGGVPDRLRDEETLTACLSGLPGGDEDVLAVDDASYAGARAVAVVQAEGPELVRVTVVAGDCSADAPDVLDQRVVPRP